MPLSIQANLTGDFVVVQLSPPPNVYTLNNGVSEGQGYSVSAGPVLSENITQGQTYTLTISGATLSETFVDSQSLQEAYRNQTNVRTVSSTYNIVTGLQVLSWDYEFRENVTYPAGTAGCDSTSTGSETGTASYNFRGSSTPLQITTSSLPNGQVGVGYDSGPLTATGGTPFPSASFPDPYTWSATKMPAGLNISYFTGDIYGLSPATPGSFFPAVTVTDFNGNTATKSFVIGVAPAQTSLYTPVEASYFALLGEHYMWWGDYYGYLGKACSETFPLAEELCAGVEALSQAYTVLGYYYEAKAADPTDTNYTVIAMPVPPSINIPAPDPSWTSAQVAAFNSLKTYILTTEQIIGLSEAEITSVNRAEGANEASDTYWEQQQIAALKQYTHLEALDLQLLLAQNTQLQTTYSQSGFPDFSVSVAEMTQFELGIAASGLPSDLRQQLTALGVDSQGLEFLQNALSSFNPRDVSGDITQNFVPSSSAASMIQQLAASFLTNGGPVVPSPPSSTACNGVYNGTFNGDITVSSGQTCTFIGGGISGNVHMTGGSLFLSNANVGGDVQINGGGVFNIGPSTTIQGQLQAQNIPGGSGLSIVYGATVKGNLQFQNNAASIEIGLPSSFPPNVIGGNLQVQNNTASTQIYNNMVSGNLLDQDNTAATGIYGNTVGVNLEVENNTVSTQVFNNSVTNNLQCQNDPSITGGGNTARRRHGSCSSF
ncbi:MAG: Ig domain-containing protein [Candidatus Acidiferrales bacterium]